MKVTALTMKNLSHGTPCAVKAACTVWTGAKGSKESDLSVFLFRYEYSANFFYKLWKRIRKYNGLVTGLTQNVDELLRSDTARLMLANSEFLVLLNQSATDREELAKLLNISDTQLGYSPGKHEQRTQYCHSSRRARQAIRDHNSNPDFQRL